MTLHELAALLHCTAPAPGDAAVQAVTEDSRRAKPGAVFVAVRGEQSDGHTFARAAVDAGAIAIIGDRADTRELCGVPYVHCTEPRRALGLAAHALAGDPSKAMTVIGVTGTNGKSSTVILIQTILEHAGHAASVFGTLGYRIGGETLDAKHTTPFGEDLAAIFKQARDAGQTHVVMEASSHALEQERVAGIDFDVAAFTNLTQDHLDYHCTMDEYRRAKLLLFERLDGPDRFTVVNLDDASADVFVEASRVRCVTFGADADCRARDIRMDVARTTFVVETPWGEAEVGSRLLGHHNVSNVLCAVAVCGGLGVPVQTIAAGVAALASAPGRFEHVDAGQPFQVIVDYAHTDDGLRNVLTASRAICGGCVITVFGCGGDRDRGKRPKMATAAAELSDFCIVTSDNPRTEDPTQIIDDVVKGMTASGKVRDTDYLVLPDRAEAIREGIRRAEPGDLVMIAGKGHEDYQILGTERIHFDDREVARAVLEELGHS
ncbi:MAG: UDP-N-acetylmuramoyl-L-alanyl-D-glutamate--2,6-diaminopimelate ligase [bacterium]|nr:UDP-N-acetylmuramoyl-L-alanyl-D-glutamate--2,6-diaminopimelate ligase [bacterium]